MVGCEKHIPAIYKPLRYVSFDCVGQWIELTLFHSMLSKYSFLNNHVTLVCVVCAEYPTDWATAESK